MSKEHSEAYQQVYEVDHYENVDGSAADMINYIFASALQKDASDIHLEPLAGALKVKLRCDGELETFYEITGDLRIQIVNRIKVMAEMNSVERRLPQDGHLSVSWSGHVYDLRVSSLPLFQGEKLVLRILGKQDQFLKVEELGFSADNLQRMKRLLAMPGGMILVCGPTGSGKTTTLYSMLGELRNSGKNIITLEDPVEYEMNGVNQVQINERTGLTFGRGLRSVLRQDPDIIMVGEIRDAESAEIAVRLAYTGHLVLASLHTGNAFSAVIRMVELGIQPHMIACCLNGIIAQRLVRKNSISHHGRIAIQEILLCDDRMQQEISNYDAFPLRKKEIEKSYPTLLDDAIRKLDEGMISYQSLKDVLGPVLEEVDRVWM